MGLVGFAGAQRAFVTLEGGPALGDQQVPDGLPLGRVDRG